MDRRLVEMADAAWALFGDDDHDAAASDKKAPPPPRASVHPFFAATRDCWCPEPVDETMYHPFSEEAARTSLNLEGRVPALAASLRGRDMREPADALRALLETPSAARASDVIAASVRALASASGIKDDLAASRLNTAILIARAVKADRALDAANEAMTTTETTETMDEPYDVAAADQTRQLAMAAAEAAVLLAECALLADDPETFSTLKPPSVTTGTQTVHEKDGRRWIGARVVAASAAAARAERAYLLAVAKTKKKQKETNDETFPDSDGKRLKISYPISSSSRSEIRLRSLSSAMDEKMRRVVSDLALVSKSEGTTHWDASKRVEVSSLTTASFYEAYVKKNRPVVIKGLLEKDQWSAVETFCDLEWLHDTYGDTPVPVEALSVDHSHSRGSHKTRYGEKKDGKGSVSVAYATLSSFLESYFAEPSPTEPLTDCDGQNENVTVAYVSQHSLLHQCPGLQHHFAVPEFCLGRLSAANAWLGTANTKTHLHTDDADNLLCQVAGFKLVKLFPPSVTPYVYQDLVDNRKTGNKSVNAFSPVDCEDVAEQKRVFPLFKKARDEEIQTVIGPGETLFVPRGWWHYVRALEPSFSVNFWF